MPQALATVYLHLVFSTKGRYPFLRDTATRAELHAFTSEVSNRLGCPALAVNGPEDHLHLLCRMSRTLTISDWVREVKRVSSGWANQRVPDFAWQSGYGVFSVSAAELDQVLAYVRNQEQHHQRESFQDEFLRLLKEHSAQWDERYLWD